MLEQLNQKLPLRVDVRLSADQLARWMNCENPFSKPQEITGICLDSRAIQKGDVFFALEAARNGHDFVMDATEKGAVASVVRKTQAIPHAFVVQNTLTALHDLTRAYRNHWGKTVMAISGSNGKTSTKEIASRLFGDDAFASPGTWNNHLGIPLSILSLNDQHRFAIVEMGINDFGDLTSYCSYAQPNIGVLTVIGDSHLMNLKNRDGVAKAKGELFDSLGPQDTAILMMDDPYLAKMESGLHCKKIKVSLSQDTDVKVTREQDKISVQYGSSTFQTPFALSGRHNLVNLACALGLAYACDLPCEHMQERIASIGQLSMRMQTLDGKGGVRWIIDCYNANPTSMNAGLDEVALQEGRKVALLGDMLELGEDSSKLHMDIGKRLFGLGFSYVVFMGQFSKDYYQGALLGGMQEKDILCAHDVEEARQKMRAFLKKDDIVFVKGSRGMRLEELIAPLI